MLYDACTEISSEAGPSFPLSLIYLEISFSEGEINRWSRTLHGMFFLTLLEETAQLSSTKRYSRRSRLATQIYNIGLPLDVFFLLSHQYPPKAVKNINLKHLNPQI